MLLFVSLSKSKAFAQHISAFVDMSNFCSIPFLLSFSLRRSFSLIKSFPIADVFIVSPSFSNLLILAFCKVLSISTTYYLHEPSLVPYLLTNVGHTFATRLKYILYSFIFVPLVVLLSEKVVFASTYALKYSIKNLTILKSSRFQSKYSVIPLPFPSPLLQSFTDNKYGHFVLLFGSFHSDYSFECALNVVKANPNVKFILLTTESKLTSVKQLSILSSFHNVNLHKYTCISDELVYQYISNSTFTLLPYSFSFQSGILPLCMALGSLPLLNDIDCYKEDQYLPPDYPYILDNTYHIPHPLRKGSIIHKLLLQKYHKLQSTSLNTFKTLFT